MEEESPPGQILSAHSLLCVNAQTFLLGGSIKGVVLASGLYAPQWFLVSVPSVCPKSWKPHLALQFVGCALLPLIQGPLF